MTCQLRYSGTRGGGGLRWAALLALLLAAAAPPAQAAGGVGVTSHEDDPPRFSRDDPGPDAGLDAALAGDLAPVGILTGPVVNPVNNHRYYLLQQASWSASEAQAVRLGGHLVTINDEPEETWVWNSFSRFAGTPRSLWIGLSDAASEGRFVWSSGEPLTYTHWGAGQPDNCCASEHYAHIFAPSAPPELGPGYWNDAAESGLYCCGDVPEDALPNGVVEQSLCGNGRTDPGEQCDDGNTNASDGCTNGCTFCGNRVVTAPERCDDGNLTDGDGCDSNCTIAACGNGVRNAGEQCDDGNSIACDGCSPSCRTEPLGDRCGDGVVSSAACGEECDDGNTRDDDACRSDCRFNVCGDGVRDPTAEACDDGNTNACDGCSPTCQLEPLGSRCGDGVVSSACGEECDDGNTNDDDACHTDCRFNVCGDGFRNPAAEQCDDGNTTACDGCSRTCANEPLGSRCGDGVLSTTCGEVCDDGNASDDDACRTDCRPNVCGDGHLNPAAEECDDGNGTPADGCTNACTICGNGSVTPPEACDDGNRVDTDACDAACRLAAVVVGTGTPESCTEAALDAALAGGRGVTFDCGPDPFTMTITSTKTIAADTTIDGGGSITISGGHAVGVVAVNSGVTFDARNLTIADGKGGQGGFFGPGGGGIYNAGTATLTNCTLSGNSAGGGGGIWNDEAATLMLENCTLSRNSAATWGGGIVNRGTATLTNCTLSGNSAAGFPYGSGRIAGGAGITNLFGTVTLTDCTLSENGSAILNGGGCGMGGCFWGSVTLTNTIIAESAGVTCEQAVFGGQLVYSLKMPAGVTGIQPGAGATGSIVGSTAGADSGIFTDGGHNLQWPGTDCGDTIPSLDPKLDPAGLQENGGPTQTIALLPDSPAIDAGDNAACSATDQRGVPRPYGAACDIGAYEQSACGNGAADPGEQCDDGNLNPGDGCTNACTMCGNGVVTPPERCDDGNTDNADDCRRDCQFNVCGDGSRNPAVEPCDDGNRIDGDGCDSNCTSTACGNGIVTASEGCDDGNTHSEDGCSAACRIESCGDGVRQAGLGEECDDGNRDAFDGCTSFCTVCGNGVRTDPEECDDGNLSDGDDCAANCTLPKVVGSGTPGSCTEVALDAALAGGGMVKFSCGNDPLMITLTRSKEVALHTTVDGGDLIALSGGNASTVFAVRAGGTLDLRRLVITEGHPGVENAGALTATECTFVGNNGDGSNGGAITNSGTLTVVRSTFVGNITSGDGGGILHTGPAGTGAAGPLTVVNSTFTGNSAAYGGAIYGFLGMVTVVNSTLVGNLALDGGGLRSIRSSLTLINAVIADNDGGDCVYSYVPNVAAHHNLVTDPAHACGLSDGVNGNLVGVDPLLDPAGLSDNGGPTQTIALLPESPAIDAGDPEACANPPVSGLDQRGYVRSGLCSIGAYEAYAIPVAACVGDCDGDGAVEVNELITGVNIALGEQPVGTCPAFMNPEGRVDIAQLIKGVNNALSGCAATGLP